MAQQGGLGRGLASLIPPKRKNTNSTVKKIPKKKNTSTGSGIFGGSSVGEVNYFSKNTFNKKKKSIKTTGNQKTGNEKKNTLKQDKKPLRDISLKSVMEIDVKEIVPNPYQPRKNFDPIKLQELADSIAIHGIIQPLVVTYKKEGGYELIAGERRLEASKLAGLKKVPVVTRTASEQNKAEWALIENIQRHNLNPIEEAQAYRQMQDEFELTQEEISEKVGKSRSAVANILRLLNLPEEIQKALETGKISEGHARTILALSDEKKQMELFKSILKDKLNVRQVEEFTKGVKVNKNYRAQKNIDPDLVELESEIADNLKTKVKIRGIKDNGKILIDYYSQEELGEIAKKLRGGDEG